MDKPSKTPSSDQLKISQAASSGNLDKHRKAALRESKAIKCQSLQLHQNHQLSEGTTDQLHQASADKSVQTRQKTKDLIREKDRLNRDSDQVKKRKLFVDQSYQDLTRQIEAFKSQLDQTLHENENLRQKLQELIRNRELKEILKKAKPELSPEVKEAYDQLQDLHSRARHDYNVSNDEHSKAFEELLGHLSPETLQEHKRCGIEFVINPNAKVFYPEVEKNAEDKWQIKLPLPYKYGVSSMMLRAIDLLLETKHQQAGDIPSPKRRADIATRVFRANFMLGQGELGKYGFPIKGYDLAEKYHKDYKDGIRQAFKDGLISKDTQKKEIIKIGHTYAHAKYLESIKPPQDIPRVFPSLQPGAYVEERRIWELNEGQQSVKVGSREFDTLMKFLDIRKQKGENFSLTVTILANKEICVQPYYIMEGLRSRHAMTAEGNHCAWAGEVDIDYETKTVIRLKDQSGHFRTYDKDNPDLMARFALEEFKKRGYDTSTTMIELTAIEDSKEFEYNYKPRTREDLKDSGGRTSSEQYIDEFRQTQQD